VSFINKDICELCYCLKDLSFFHPIYSFQLWQDQCFNFNIVILLKWFSCITVFWQIWWYSKDESTKILSTLLHCRKLWQIFMIFFLIQKNSKFLIIFFPRNTFQKWWEHATQKIRWARYIKQLTCFTSS
jgi:hypothetical protein